MSDGKKASWDRLQPGPNDAHASVVLREMALLERIASFHQTGDEPGTQTDDRLA